jgi:hypothetical protein
MKKISPFPPQKPTPLRASPRNCATPPVIGRPLWTTNHRPPSPGRANHATSARQPQRGWERAGVRAVPQPPVSTRRHKTNPPPPHANRCQTLPNSANACHHPNPAKRTHQPPPAQTCHNLPKPAAAFPLCKTNPPPRHTPLHSSLRALRVSVVTFPAPLAQFAKRTHRPPVGHPPTAALILYRCPTPSPTRSTPSTPP